MSNSTKQQLINCAEMLFREKGFKKTRVIDITNLAGVAKGTFYIYFETKNSIIDEIVMGKFIKIFFDIIEKASEEKEPLEFIDYIIDANVEKMLENEKLMSMVHDESILEEVSFLDYTDNCRKYGVEKILIETSDKYASCIKKVLDKGIKQGIFREIDTNLYSKMLFYIVHNTIEFAHFHNEPADVKTVSEELKLMVKLILLKS